MRKCVEKCKLEHDSFCGGSKSTSTRSAPARLLQFSKDRQSVKLLNCSQRPPRYVALSHCWGNDSTITTTEENLKRHQKGFSILELPPLFQDAAQITSELGLDHLWVDSLSIVQDLHSDWAKESAKMADIYSGAEFTIAAADAPNSSHRILTPRKAAVKLKYSNTKREEFSLKCRMISDHHPDLSAKVPAAIRGPLMSRAWTLQEHVMSTRIFHFTSSEIIFECRTSFSCQCKPAVKNWPTTPSLFRQLKQYKKSYKKYATWHRLVEKYTLRSLTRGSDKLPALSGLASEFQGIVRSEYCAGLWKENLIEDLLWSSAPWLHNPVATPPPIEYRAPSFSWASTDTQVRFEEHSADDRGSITHVSKVLDVQIEQDEWNIFGSVGQSSKLKIKGPIIQGVLIAPEDYSFYYKLKLRGSASGTVDVFPDCAIVQNDPVKPEGNLRRARSGEPYTSFKEPVQCLILTTNSTEGTATGLVLATSASAENTFTRLGLFSCGVQEISSGEKRTVNLI